ncbi:MAG: PorV/PorQ family protein [Candidatus Margulisbacteria bacterium]|jgi:hypothetical protein|nr:PorV/PorQ family protein [Candidatus Margulisiibacteriota bacterium]
MRKLLLIFLVVFLQSSLFAAVNGPGTTGANYLKIGLGAKAAALGESYTAAADDTSSIYWNTAGLSAVRNPRVDFMQLNWLAGISAKTIFGAAPLSDKDTFGAYIMMLDTPKDKETVYAGGGSLTQYEETGKNFNSAISVLNLGYSRIISRSLDAGIGLKMISEDLAGEKADGLALDAGLIYKDLIPNLKLGLNVQNIGLKNLRPEEELPMTIALGAEYSTIFLWNKLSLLLDAKLPNDNDPRFGVGAEYWLGQYFAGRIGYNTFNQMSLGLGVAFANFNADYAYVPIDDLGVTHRISVGYTFGIYKQPENSRQELQADAEKGTDAAGSPLKKVRKVKVKAQTQAQTQAPSDDTLPKFDF